MIGSVLIEEAELGDDMAGLFSKLKKNLHPFRGPVLRQVIRNEHRNPGPVPPYRQWDQWRQHTGHQNKKHHNKHRKGHHRGNVYPYRHQQRQDYPYQHQGQTYPYQHNSHQPQHHHQGQGYPYQTQTQGYPYHPQAPNPNYPQAVNEYAPVVSNRYADALDPLRRHYNPWGQRELSGFEGVWDTITEWVNPSMTAPTAKGADAATAAANMVSANQQGTAFDRFMNTATKTIGSGLVLANAALEVKAKAKGARNAAAQRGYDEGAITAEEAVRYSRGDVDPRPWTEKDNIIKGVSNLVVVGGGAAALALILVLKKRRG